MTKKFTREGIGGVYKGTVEITSRTEVRTVQVPVIHEEREQSFQVFDIRSSIGAIAYGKSEGVSEVELIKKVQIIESDLTGRLNFLATTKPTKSVNEMLAELGYS